MTPWIFVSYRRDDSEGYAVLIRKKLEDYFGRDAIFQDIVSIPPGRNIRRYIDDAIKSCRVLLAIMDKQWVDIRDVEGKRRLNEPHDFVRLEIASALENELTVIPVLLRGTPMPQEAQLPEPLKPLVELSGYTIGTYSFDDDLDRLIDWLEQEYPQYKKPESTTVERVKGDNHFNSSQRRFNGTLMGHTDLVGDLSFSPDGAILASASGDSTVRLWNIYNGEQVQTFRGNGLTVGSLSFSPDGHLLAADLGDGISILDLSTGKAIQNLEIPNRTAVSAFSPDGRLIAVSGNDTIIRFWKVLTGDLIVTLEGHSSVVTDLLFFNSGRRLLSGSWDETIRIWDIPTKQQIIAIEPRIGWINTLSLANDERSLLVAADDMEIWDIRAKKILRHFDLDSKLVHCARFSPSCNLIASGHGNGEVILWNINSGQPLKTFEGHTQLIHSVAFSPDGRTLASSSQDKTIMLWDITAFES